MEVMELQWKHGNYRLIAAFITALFVAVADKSHY